jgi:hypothetical protein
MLARQRSQNVNIIHLPPELLTEIIRYACTDGGWTACALREVSRSFRALVEPFRLQCAAIYGLDKLKACRRELQCIPSEAWLIRHLFVSQLPPVMEQGKPEYKPSLIRRALGYLKRKGSRNTDESSNIIWFYVMLNRVLEICVPTLTSLTLHFSIKYSEDHHWTAVGSHLHFPVLQRLSIAYYNTKQLTISWIETRNMPVLETLWISIKPSMLAAGHPLSFLTKSETCERPIPLTVLEGLPKPYMIAFAEQYTDGYQRMSTEYHWIFDCLEVYTTMSSNDEAPQKPLRFFSGTVSLHDITRMDADEDNMILPQEVGGFR